MNEKWTAPSRKWLAARVTALAGLATLVATNGAWTQEATIMAITVVSAALLAYLLPNSDGGGGERGLSLLETIVVLLVVAVVVLAVVVLT